MNSFNYELPNDETEGDLVSIHPKARSAPCDVYVLGAGFSHAVHSVMPVVSKLSQVVTGFATSYPWSMETSGLNSAIGKMIHRDFEQAMSYLAEYKPWLDETENHKDKVLLLELTRNIRFAIGRCLRTVRPAIEAGECDWLVPLFEYWHRSEAVVITLNYDTLVEEIVERIGSKEYPGIPIPDQPTSTRRDPRSFLRVANIHPPILRDKWLGSSEAGWGNYIYGQPSFRLLKLHGSVNWLKSSNPNAFSDTISYIRPNQVPVDSGTPLPPWIADKEPFIVPPVPNKGSLVFHDSLRAMWREAADAIKYSKRIVLMGYSMPENDALLVQLIRGGLFNTRPAIELVNPDKKLLPRVLEMLEGENVTIMHRYNETDCVRRFVDEKAFL